ncbi:MAG: DegT/DnrJ/EryC1/StrS family aminotransferase [Gemmataceae bacterium]
MANEAVAHAVQAALRDGSWGKYVGGQVERWEARLAAYHQVQFAVTCGSGTLAVELALRALRVGPGDDVVLAAYDYPGNLLGVHAVGARPVLVDVEPRNWNLAVPALAAALGPNAKAVIVSHLHGGLVPMPQVLEWTRARGVSVIEDAAQAPGARVAGRWAGSWGDVGVLSFGGSKLLTAGRGGALLTDRPDLRQRLRVLMTRAGNVVYPMSELQAAVLAPQLEQLDADNAQRRRGVNYLIEQLADVPGLRPFVNDVPDSEASFYKMGWQLDETAFGLERSRFVAALRAEGIAFDAGFAALHVGRSPKRFHAAGALREAENAHRGAVVLHHPVLLSDEQAWDEVARAVRKVYAYGRHLRQ